MNSKFQPFSFERYIQPLQIYGQAYREQEDALAELDTKASIWEGMANEQTDPIAHAQYKKYADDLKAQATLIATEGLNPSSRQAMLNLRGRYAKEIVPIEQAYQRRAEQIAEQRKAGNQMIHSYDASTTSLDEFLGNPSLSYKSIDRAKLLQESTSLMSQFANELRDFRFDGNLDRFHKKLVESYGLTKDEATQFANAIASGTIDNNNAVQALAQHIYNSTGVADWNNATASNRVWQTIAEGVTAGIGKQSAKAVTDQGAVMAQQHAYAKELERMKEESALRIAAAKKKADDLTAAGQAGAIVPLRSMQELNTAGQNIEKYKKYFKQNPDGTWEMTKEGFDNLYSYWSDYSGYTSAPEGSIGNAGTTAFAPTEFGKFMTSLNGGKPLVMVKKDYSGYEAIPGTGPKYRGNLFANYIKSNQQGSYDTYHTTEVDIPIASDYQDDLTANVWRNTAKGAKIKEVDFNGTKREWTPTGNEYSAEDLQGYKVTALRPSRYGMTAFLHKDGAEDIRILVPKGVNIANLEAVQNNMAEINRLVQAAYSEYLPMQDAQGYIAVDDRGEVIWSDTKSDFSTSQYFLNLAEQAKANMIHHSITISRPATATTDKH